MAPHLALATAVAHAGRDDELALLLDACNAAGIATVARAWDDPTVSWGRFDAVMIRSTWDYTQRLPQFLAWCERVSKQARLINPLPVIRWNTDKHYLRELAADGIPVVATHYVEPADEPLPALQAFLAAHPDASEFVLKPAVGAGSHDAQRYARTMEFAAANRLARLLDAGRSAMLQPYLASVDHDGETGLIHFAGQLSHAIRKGPQLDGADGRRTGSSRNGVTLREPGDDERAVASQVLAAASQQLGLAAPLLYARVDLLRGADSSPRLLELELCEPSLFLPLAPGSAERLAALVLQSLK